MRTREQRIMDFEKFQESVVPIFKKLQTNNPDYLSLGDYYGFSVCPHGRNGGISSRLIEVFYENRPFDQEKEISANLELHTHLLSESGAELSLFRDDFGYVSVQLFPAKSKYGRQREDSILLHSHLDPNVLLKPSFQEKLFLRLNSYMAITCLEGRPTVCDNVRVFLIRLNKHLVIKEELQQIKVLKWLEEMLKFALTVGLSGFLLNIIL